jgi:hypothetical protein
MQVADWVALFRKFPVEYQELLMLATNNGIELAVQQVLQLNDTFILIRGRLGGTTDMDRIFMVPYDYLSFVYFTRPVSNEKLRPVFGELLAVGAGGVEAVSHETLSEVPAVDVATEPTGEDERDIPMIDPTTLQPQARPQQAVAPKSVAASLRERLLRSRGTGPRPG